MPALAFSFKKGRNNMGLFGKEKTIKSAKLLGMRTAKETLIISTVNFSVYSFFVEYTDGSSATIELSPNGPHSGKNEKQKFARLMELANADSGKESQHGNNSSSNPIGDLKDLKSLFDAGVITEEVYEAKKGELLAQISGQSNTEPSHNIIIRRKQSRPLGEGKTIVLIDGEKRKELDLDRGIKEKLSNGIHTISFNRVALSSKKYEITISTSKCVEVVVNPKVFSIEVEVFNQ